MRKIKLQNCNQDETNDDDKKNNNSFHNDNGNKLSYINITIIS